MLAFYAERRNAAGDELSNEDESEVEAMVSNVSLVLAHTWSDASLAAVSSKAMRSLKGPIPPKVLRPTRNHRQTPP